MPKRPLVAANWKMHFLSDDVRSWGASFVQGSSNPTAEVVVFPSHPLLAVTAKALEGAPAQVGGQDLHPEDEGAHTGDVSPRQLADAGCSWALCGHSERRHDHGEGDESVASKVAAAARHGLTPVLCLGETAEQRRAGETEEVLGRQLEAGLARAPADLVVAYEPVWAIGTGDTATPEIAQEAHAYLRSRLAELRSPVAADGIRILYGGSVKPGNAAELFTQEDIDGFLVGGASLDAEKFLAIMGVCD